MSDMGMLVSTLYWFGTAVLDTPTHRLIVQHNAIGSKHAYTLRVLDKVTYRETKHKFNSTNTLENCVARMGFSTAYDWTAR